MRAKVLRETDPSGGTWGDADHGARDPLPGALRGGVGQRGAAI